MTQIPALRVLIVDDEAPARARLRDLLQDLMSDVAQKLPLTIAGEAATGQQALEQAESADVLLLDIRMPDLDGLEVAQHLLKLEHPPAVIFTTAYDAHALEAFEVRAVDYLLKPIRRERLFDALSRIGETKPELNKTMRAGILQELRAESHQSARLFLSANERGRVHLIPIADILFLKAELKYVTVRTAVREYLIEESLTNLEQEFATRFVRIHRNCLVARSAVRGFERAIDEEGEGGWAVVIKGVNEKLAVSRRQQHIVREFGKLA